MQEVKIKRVKRSIVLRIALGVFAIYVVGALIAQQVQIAEKKQQLETMQQQLVIQEITNDEKQAFLESDDLSYVERIARESLDYAKPGERIFINISGK